AVTQAAAAGSCATTHCFDFLHAAPEFSKLTSGLAAITFAGLTFLVARTADRERLEDTIVMFAAAFLSLVVPTFLYGRLSGEELPGRRGQALYFAGSLVFVLGVLQLFLGLTRLLMRLGFRQASTFMRGVSVAFIPPVSFVFLLITAVDAYAGDRSEAT